MNERPEFLWIRYGDMGDYHKIDWFSCELDQHLDPTDVGTFVAWERAGVITSCFEGRNYISLFWGDKNANWIRDLNDKEKAEVQHMLSPSMMYSHDH